MTIFGHMLTSTVRRPPLHRAMQFYTIMNISIISKNTSYSNRFSYIFESMTLIFSYSTSVFLIVLCLHEMHYLSVVPNDSKTPSVCHVSGAVQCHQAAFPRFGDPHILDLSRVKRKTCRERCAQIWRIVSSLDLRHFIEIRIDVISICSESRFFTFASFFNSAKWANREIALKCSNLGRFLS